MTGKHFMKIGVIILQVITILVVNTIMIAPLLHAYKPSTMFDSQVWLFPLIMNLSDYSTGMSILLGTFKSATFDRQKRGELVLMAYIKNFIIFAILANFGTETRVSELTFFNSFLNVIYQFFAPVVIALTCSMILNHMISTKKITRTTEDSDTDDDEHS